MKTSDQRQSAGGLRRHLLYEQFGFRENPFGVTPNPKFLYESKTHGEAKASLIIGLECGVGFQALIAPPGMGKTTILFHVLQRFQDTAQTAFLFQLQGNSRDFLRYLLSELGTTPAPNDVASTQDAINELLLRQSRAGRMVIVVVDEAQNLNLEVLEAIRLLSNFETASEKMLQIILSGQPQLAETLAKPELAQLRQRISMFTTLAPFGQADTKKYIEHRLRLAGYEGGEFFTPGALRAIWRHSQGIPRRINALCFNALLLAGTADRQLIDELAVAEVVRDRDLDLLASSKFDYQPSSPDQKAEVIELPTPASAVDENSYQEDRVEYEPLQVDASSSTEESPDLPRADTETILAPEDATLAAVEETVEEPTDATVPEETAAPPATVESVAFQDNVTRANTPVRESRSPWRKQTGVLIGGSLVLLLCVGGIVSHWLGHAPRAAAAVPRLRESLVQASAVQRASVPPARVPTATAPLDQPTVYVQDIAHYSTASSTTVKISLQGPVKYIGQRLDSPDRVFFDLQNTKLPNRLTGTKSQVNELAVSRIRIAQYEPAVTRITLVTKGFCDYSQRFLPKTAQLIIEVRPRSLSASNAH